MPQPLLTPPPARRAPTEEVRPGFPHERIMIFGLIQLLSGVASIILATVAIAIMAWGYFIGSGIWCGAFFIVSGIIGILSSKKKDNCMIISFMVMSILTAIISGIQVGIASSGIIIDLHFNRTEILVVELEEDIKSYHESLVQVIVVHCLILLIAIIDGVCAIVSSALCCRTVCCGVLLPLGLEERFMPPGTRVQYLPGTIEAEDQHGNIQQFAFISPTSPQRDGDIYTFNSGAIMIQPPGMMPQFCMIPPPGGMGQFITGPPPPYSSREELELSLPPSYPGTPLQRLAMRTLSQPSSAHSTLSRADDQPSNTATTIHIVRPIWRPAFRPATSSPRASISRNNNQFTAVLESDENLINNIRSSEMSYSMNSSMDRSSTHETEPMIALVATTGGEGRNKRVRGQVGGELRDTELPSQSGEMTSQSRDDDVVGSRDEALSQEEPLLSQGESSQPDVEVAPPIGDLSRPREELPHPLAEPRDELSQSRDELLVPRDTTLSRDPSSQSDDQSAPSQPPTAAE